LREKPTGRQIIEIKCPRIIRRKSPRPLGARQKLKELRLRETFRESIRRSNGKRMAFRKPCSKSVRKEERINYLGAKREGRNL